jgi:hypothetical protein
MNTDRGHLKADQFGPGSGNRRDAWRPHPTSTRWAASTALSTAWALMAGNASPERYPRAGGRHRARGTGLVEWEGPNRR